MRYVVKIGLIGLMREKRGERLGGGEMLFDRYRFCGTIPRPPILRVPPDRDHGPRGMS